MSTDVISNVSTATGTSVIDTIGTCGVAGDTASGVARDVVTDCAVQGLSEGFSEQPSFTCFRSCDRVKKVLHILQKSSGSVETYSLKIIQLIVAPGQNGALSYGGIFSWGLLINKSSNSVD